MCVDLLASESQRVAKARRAYLVDAVVSSIMPGRRRAHRSISLRSVSGSRDSRSSPGAFSVSPRK